MSKVTNKRHF